MKIKVFNISVEISYILIAALCIAVILSENIITTAAIVSAILHETAHIAVMRRYSNDEISLKAGLFNIVISDPLREVGGYNRDISILCAGPIVNITLWAMFFFIYKITSFKFAYDISMVNASLGVFNLLPLETTDGGQILNIVLGRMFGAAAADRVVFIISIIFFIPLAIIGFYTLVCSKYNYTMLAAAAYITGAVLSVYF